MIKLIVFDWDDVFTLGSKEGYIRCLHETLVRLGVNLDPEEEKRRILYTWSKPHREELRNLLKEKPELLEEACRIYEEIFFGGEFVKSLTLVKGSDKLLQELSKKYILTVATGAHPKVLKEEVFPKFGIPDVFAEISFTYEIDDPEHHKPHPYMVETILNHQGIKPEEAILVGDAKNDVVMAQRAKVIPVVVLTGHLNRQEAEGLGVEYIIEDVTQLESILQQINEP